MLRLFLRKSRDLLTKLPLPGLNILLELYSMMTTILHILHLEAVNIRDFLSSTPSTRLGQNLQGLTQMPLQWLKTLLGKRSLSLEITMALSVSILQATRMMVEALTLLGSLKTLTFLKSNLLGEGLRKSGVLLGHLLKVKGIMDSQSKLEATLKRLVKSLHSTFSEINPFGGQLCTEPTSMAWMRL